MSDRLFQRLWGAACLWIIVAAIWHTHGGPWWAGLPAIPFFVYGLLRKPTPPKDLPERPRTARDRAIGVLAPIVLVAIIVGVWLIGEALPKINAAWLLLAFIGGFVVGVWVLTSIVKPMLEGERQR